MRSPETLNVIQSLPDRSSPAIIVDVSECDGIWTAECDALGLVTEADDLDTLKGRVWEIAPDLAARNEVGDPSSLRLRFMCVPAQPEE